VTGANAPDLGPCASDWCDRPAVVYVSGPTCGTSPRVTIIGGARAMVLAEQVTALSVRCLDCAVHAVEDVAAGMVRVEHSGAAAA
jgi:hypothetical protein